MAKVKMDVQVKDGVDKRGYLNVLWYVGDEEGYGVEIQGADGTVKDWSFGDNKPLDYIVSAKWFDVITDNWESWSDIEQEKVLEIDYLVEGGEIEEGSESDIEELLELIHKHK